MATPKQVRHLLAFLKEEKEMAKGCLRSFEGRLKSRRLWAQLTEELNAMGGSIKTTKQWQRVWADKKYLTRKAVAAAKRSAATTEGGPSKVPPGHGADPFVLEIMEPTFGSQLASGTAPLFPKEESTTSGEEQCFEPPKKKKRRAEYIEQFKELEKDRTRALEQLTSAVNSLVSKTSVIEELTLAVNSLVSVLKNRYNE